MKAAPKAAPKRATKPSPKPRHKPIRVGLLGIGTVGGGVWEVLRIRL